MKTADKPLGLYIHIPFCKSKCVYCDFYSLPHREDRMDTYTDALCAHLIETAPFAAGHAVDTVYFGGGTPSYLGEKRLVKLLKVIQKKYRVTKDAEVTLEANPDSAGDWKYLKALRKAGVNRLSLGMQSASDEELRAIGRVHTMAQVRAAVEAARKAKRAPVLPKYKGPNGELWTGRGRTPKWAERVMDSGEDIRNYLINKPSAE